MTKRLITIFLASFLTIIGCSETDNFLSGIRNGQELEGRQATEFSLAQNYPNPFNPSTLISYSVQAPIHLTMKVYTEDWQVVKTLVDTLHVPGSQSISFDATNQKNEQLASGEYFYTLEGNGLTMIRRMKLLK